MVVALWPKPAHANLPHCRQNAMGGDEDGTCETDGGGAGGHDGPWQGSDGTWNQGDETIIVTNPGDPTTVPSTPQGGPASPGTNQGPSEMSCPQAMEQWNGECVLKCARNEERDRSTGECVQRCALTEERDPVWGCVQRCRDGQERDPGNPRNCVNARARELAGRSMEAIDEAEDQCSGRDTERACGTCCGDVGWARLRRAHNNLKACRLNTQSVVANACGRSGQTNIGLLPFNAGPKIILMADLWGEIGRSCVPAGGDQDFPAVVVDSSGNTWPCPASSTTILGDVQEVACLHEAAGFEKCTVAYHYPMSCKESWFDRSVDLSFAVGFGWGMPDVEVSASTMDGLLQGCDAAYEGAILDYRGAEQECRVNECQGLPNDGQTPIVTPGGGYGEN